MQAVRFALRGSTLVGPLRLLRRKGTCGDRIATILLYARFYTMSTFCVKKILHLYGTRPFFTPLLYYVRTRIRARAIVR